MPEVDPLAAKLVLLVEKLDGVLERQQVIVTMLDSLTAKIAAIPTSEGKQNTFLRVMFPIITTLLVAFISLVVTVLILFVNHVIHP